ncbi:unnamed protein product [Cuscuta epithymum]|uniref:Uncharacterized protein n=1 Tax=Cuscuta epithymum TaxID=186058 RepID=A0AAV0DFZ5_9ASTE|nr:unnamed protein product [Cuscuta epithymum]
MLSAGGPRSISSYLDVPDRPEKHIVGAESDDDDEEAQPFIACVASTATKEKEHGAPPNRVTQIPRRVRVTNTLVISVCMFMFLASFGCLIFRKLHTFGVIV